MASIHKRQDAPKPYRVHYRDAAGNQHGRSFSTRKEAVAFRAKVEGKKPGGSKGRVTLEQAAREFIADREATRRPGTAAAYKTTLRTFLASVPVKSVRGVTPSHVMTFRNRRRENRTPKTVNNDLKRLCCFFNWCGRRGWLDSNPASPKVVEHPRFKRKIPEWLDEAETAALLADVRENCEDHFVRLAVVLAARAGLRLGEISGLRWSDIREGEGVLTIVEDSKSAGPRVVPMHADVVAVLHDTPVTGDYVLPAIRSNNGGPHLNTHAFGVKVRGWLKAHGHAVGPHGLRHSFASQLAMLGGSEDELRELLGHTSADTTRLYTHSRPGHRAELVARLGGEHR